MRPAAAPRSIPKGLLAGAVAGLVGSVALRVWTTAFSKLHANTYLPDANGPAHQVGALLAEKFARHPLTPGARLLAGEITHYAFGAVNGAIYGALAERYTWTTAGCGLLFGTGVFLAADESSMPALGLIPPPWREAPAAQLEHLAAHVVFGITTELTRNALREVTSHRVI